MLNEPRLWPPAKNDYPIRRQFHPIHIAQRIFPANKILTWWELKYLGESCYNRGAFLITGEIGYAGLIDFYS